MFELPTSVVINGNDYPIRNRGDYRMVIDCFNALDDEELDEANRILTCLIIFYDGMMDEESVLGIFGDDLKQAVTEMFNFFNCGQQSIGQQVNYKLIDWSQDAQLIAGAVNLVAQKEIRSEPYLHWWTFMGYYLSVGESALSTVVEIRHKIKTGKKLEKYEQEFRRNNPQYFVWNSKTVEQKAADDYIRSLWEHKE